MYSTRDAPHGTPLAFFSRNHTNAIIELVRFVRPYRSPFKTIENASCRFVRFVGKKQKSFVGNKKQLSAASDV